MPEMLPQPPPDAPAPPSEAALRSQKWWKWMLVVGIGAILVLVLAGLVAPSAPKLPQKNHISKASYNMHHLSLALLEFEASYGAFPNDQTVEAVKQATRSTMPLGSSTSNDYFRQLFATAIFQTESIFYVMSPNARKPDDVFTGSEALKKGECAFAYIAGLTSKHSPETPVVVFPLIPGKRAFDKNFCDKHYDGKGFILRVDGTVRLHPVDASGRVWIDGKDIFDPDQPYWGGTAPDVKWPE
jgi:hypothetical protein